jgi:hypothetical protein
LLIKATAIHTHLNNILLREIVGEADCGHPLARDMLWAASFEREYSFEYEEEGRQPALAFEA